jgi:hypothetical protein
MERKNDQQEENKLRLQFKPSLISQLKAAEVKKGFPLTEDEVMEIRDSAPCMAVNAQIFRISEEAQGYKDIDPENCWSEWCKIKTTF